MIREPSSQRQNLILGMLPKAAYGELQARLELVTLPLGTVLYDAGEPIQHVYFPRTALVSLVGLTERGQGMEMSMIGPEGFLGLPIVLEVASQQYEATIQMAGSLWETAQRGGRRHEWQLYPTHGYPASIHNGPVDPARAVRHL